MVFTIKPSTNRSTSTQGSNTSKSSKTSSSATSKEKLYAALADHAINEAKKDISSDKQFWKQQGSSAVPSVNKAPISEKLLAESGSLDKIQSGAVLELGNELLTEQYGSSLSKVKAFLDPNLNGGLVFSQDHIDDVMGNCQTIFEVMLAVFEMSNKISNAELSTQFKNSIISSKFSQAQAQLSEIENINSIDYSNAMQSEQLIQAQIKDESALSQTDTTLSKRANREDSTKASGHWWHINIAKNLVRTLEFIYLGPIGIGLVVAEDVLSHEKYAATSKALSAVQSALNNIQNGDVGSMAALDEIMGGVTTELTKYNIVFAKLGEVDAVISFVLDMVMIVFTIISSLLASIVSGNPALFVAILVLVVIPMIMNAIARLVDSIDNVKLAENPNDASAKAQEESWKKVCHRSSILWETFQGIAELCTLGCNTAAGSSPTANKYGATNLSQRQVVEDEIHGSLTLVSAAIFIVYSIVTGNEAAAAEKVADGVADVSDMESMEKDTTAKKPTSVKGGKPVEIEMAPLDSSGAAIGGESAAADLDGEDGALNNEERAVNKKLSERNLEKEEARDYLEAYQLSNNELGDKNLASETEEKAAAEDKKFTKVKKVPPNSEIEMARLDSAGKTITDAESLGSEATESVAKVEKSGFDLLKNPKFADAMQKISNVVLIVTRLLQESIELSEQSAQTHNEVITQLYTMVNEEIKNLAAADNSQVKDMQSILTNVFESLQKLINEMSTNESAEMRQTGEVLSGILSSLYKITGERV